MKKILVGLMSVVAIIGVLVSYAQKPVQKKHVAVYKGTTVADSGLIVSGKLPVGSFEQLLRSKLLSKDSVGRLNPVVSYSFSYAERGVFEDSTGKLRIMTDYYSIESEHGQMPEFFLNSIKNLAKSGDTITYTEVLSFFPDSARTRYYSKPLKLVLTD